MTKERAGELAHKFLQNSITTLEQTELQAWYNERLEEPFIVPENFARSKKEHSKRMLEAINSAISIKSAVILWPRIAIAAAFALLIIGAGLFYFSHQKLKQNQVETYAIKILPGKTGATLTLANGKQIKLASVGNGQVANEAGIIVTKTANGQLVYRAKEITGAPGQTNTLTTAKGEAYILILPDSSKVWMNAASSLTYSTSLIENGQRRVRLQGEAYFEISKDTAHPFIVSTGTQEVKVLGTHFNINSYKDEASVKTTLLEGSIQVSTIHEKIILKPNQQSILSQDGIKVIPVLAESFTDWKEGVFQFKKEGLQSVMRKISRWYDVEIEYQGTGADTQTFSGTISRSDDILTVLRTLEKSTDLKLRIEKQKVIVFR